MRRPVEAARALFLTLAVAAGRPALAQDQPPRPGLPHDWQWWHGTPASPNMHRVYDLHWMLLLIMIAVCVFVTVLMAYVIVRYRERRNPVPSRTSHNTFVEIVWTGLPVLLLLAIAVPSFRTLYFEHRIPPADLNIKVTGRQWYWDYTYPDDGGFTFSSLMVADDSLKPGDPRLLETDNHLVVPTGKVVRVLVTGGDVIHSWAMPYFGIKIDAIPGRLNEAWFKAEYDGLYYGQCSEICGANHAFMPITIEAVPQERFDAWVADAKQRFASTDAPRHLAEMDRENR
jgi:cytochrome c oxidase subunit 2